MECCTHSEAVAFSKYASSAFMQQLLSRIRIAWQVLLLALCLASSHAVLYMGCGPAILPAEGEDQHRQAYPHGGRRPAVLPAPSKEQNNQVYAGALA